MLAITLEKALKLGLARALITSDADNIPSIRIVEKNCGLLENKVLSKKSGKPFCDIGLIYLI